MNTKEFDKCETLLETMDDVWQWANPHGDTDRDQYVSILCHSVATKVLGDDRAHKWWNSASKTATRQRYALLWCSHWCIRTKGKTGH